MRNFELELELINFELEVSYKKNLIQKLIYHFYNVNTYIWCYQYTGIIMIQSFGSLIYHLTGNANLEPKFAPPLLKLWLLKYYSLSPDLTV